MDDPQECKIPFIRLPRAFFTDDETWRTPRTYSFQEAMLDLSAMVAHTPTVRIVRGKTIKIGQGEGVMSERFIAQRWNWSRKRVRTFLRLQKEVYGLRQRVDQQETIIYYDILGSYENRTQQKEPLNRPESEPPFVPESNPQSEPEEGPEDEPKKAQARPKRGPNSRSKEDKNIIYISLLDVVKLFKPNAKEPRPKKEQDSWKKFKTPPTLEEFETIKWFYSVPKSADYDETWRRKQDVPTLLNNWQDMLETAIAFRERKGVDADGRKKISPPSSKYYGSSDDPNFWNS